MKGILYIFGLLISSAVHAHLPLLKISPADFDRRAVIVRFEMDKKFVSQGYNCVIDQRTHHKAFLQRLPNNRFVFVLPDSLKAGDTGYFKLIRSKPSTAIYPVSVDLSEKSRELTLSVDHHKILVYKIKLPLLPKGVDSVYNRSGFIHPLLSPSGKILTDDFPVGHAHQHGIMMAWPNTIFKSRPVDFWNQHQKTGNVKHLKISNIESGIVFTKINLNLQHYSTDAGLILDEEWTITVYPFSTYFLFDIASIQKNITNDTLFINKNAYGGVSFRGNKQWNNADSLHFREKWIIETNNGDDLKKADGKKASYVAAAGIVDGKACGLTVFSFPSNYLYPQPVRVHPVMPYWCFAPNAAGAFTLAPGESYRASYRYFVYDGFINRRKNDLINEDLKFPTSASFIH